MSKSIEGGISPQEKSEGEMRKEIWLPIEEVMSKVRYGYQKNYPFLRLGELVPDSEEEQDRTILRVNIDEYFSLLQKVFKDNDLILSYKDKFNPEFINDLVDMYRVSNSDISTLGDKQALIRDFLGITDHNRWAIEYENSDEEMLSWFLENVLKNGRYKGDLSNLHWFSENGDIAFKEYEFKNGKFSYQFLGSDNGSIVADIPDSQIINPKRKHDDIGLLEEMKRVLELIKNNPNIKQLEISPGVGTTIRPTWRERNEIEFTK